jgi:tripartite-type tricarboxylate transporter receptor subunit TctC
MHIFAGGRGDSARDRGKGARARDFVGLPDVPTFEESGVADFRVGGWYGILAPAGTPRPVVMRLNKEIIAAVQAPEVRSRFADALVTPGTGTPEDFTAFLKAEAARWSQLIKTVGIKVD